MSVYVNAKIKDLANSLGLKLHVSKRGDKDVLNIYCTTRDRMLCNYDGYGRNYMRARFKIMSEATFKTLPFTITTKEKLIEVVKQIAEINDREKYQ